MKKFNLFLSVSALIFAAFYSGKAQDGTVISEQKISDIEGNFSGTIADSDELGQDVANIGDLDNDGVNDLAIGVAQDDDGGSNRGAVWILFMNSDGTVKSHQKISATQGNFTGILDDGDGFGHGVAGLGDLDNDGVEDIVANAWLDDDGGNNRGATWILFLNTNGTVKSHQKISDTQGNFTGTLADSDWFGSSVGAIGDIDDDGVMDIAIGVIQDNDGGSWDLGSYWILFLNTNGTVKSHQKISATQGNFTYPLSNGNEMGTAVTGIGDLDGDNVEDIAISSGRINTVWILFLNTNGTVKNYTTITGSTWFGAGLAGIGDFNADGNPDLAIGTSAHKLWIYFLNSNGTVQSQHEISDGQGGFSGTGTNGDQFGYSVANMGDLNGNGIVDLVTGEYSDDDGGTNRGAAWVLFMDGQTPLPTELLSFDAQWESKEQTSALLTWATASETNNEFFFLEKSVDATHFEDIARIDGAGNSEKEINYSYVDNAIQEDEKTLFYRLRQVDFDGSISYSEIKALQKEQGINLITLYPNPNFGVFDFLVSSSVSSTISVSIIDYLGKTVKSVSYEASEGINAYQMDVQELSSANYSIVVETEKGTYRTSSKFIIGKE